jgi:hypothetical protein
MARFEIHVLRQAEGEDLVVIEDLVVLEGSRYVTLSDRTIRIQDHSRVFTVESQAAETIGKDGTVLFDCEYEGQSYAVHLKPENDEAKGVLESFLDSL